MVTCIMYDASLKDQWDSFVDDCKTPLFFFKRDFLEYHADRFIDSSLMFYEDDALVAILPATKLNDQLVSHGGITYGGFLYSARLRAATLRSVFEVFRDWASAAGFRKAIYKAIPPIFHAQPAQEDLYFIHNALGGTVYRRDLSSVIYLKDRLKLSKGRKWLIARAKKLGLEVSVSKDWSRFHDLLTDVLVKHGAEPVHSIDELKLLASRFGNNIELKAVDKDGVMIAAALLFKFNNVVHSQYLATSELGKETGALDYLIEEVIQDTKASGYEFFSFGISTENQGRTLNDGLLQQKESFGARGMVIDFYGIDIE